MTQLTHYDFTTYAEKYTGYLETYLKKFKNYAISNKYNAALCVVVAIVIFYLMYLFPATLIGIILLLLFTVLLIVVSFIIYEDFLSPMMAKK